MTQNKIIIGLTGSIGSGKSAVSNIFRQLGVSIIDGDIVSRKVVLNNSPAIKELKSEFGKKVIDDTGNLNRKALGEIVFCDDELLKKLNAIMEKYITKEIEKEIDEAFLNENCQLIIIDGALLFEMKLELKCNCTIGVFSSEAIRVKRIMKRNSYSYQEALKRIQAQATIYQNLKKCDFIINNINSTGILELIVYNIYSEILNEYEATEKNDKPK